MNPINLGNILHTVKDIIFQQIKSKYKNIKQKHCHEYKRNRTKN